MGCCCANNCCARGDGEEGLKDPYGIALALVLARIGRLEGVVERAEDGGGLFLSVLPLKVFNVRSLLSVVLVLLPCVKKAASVPETVVVEAVEVPVPPMGVIVVVGLDP